MKVLIFCFLFFGFLTDVQSELVVPKIPEKFKEFVSSFSPFSKLWNSVASNDSIEEPVLILMPGNLDEKFVSALENNCNEEMRKMFILDHLGKEKFNEKPVRGEFYSAVVTFSGKTVYAFQDENGQTWVGGVKSPGFWEDASTLNAYILQTPLFDWKARVNLVEQSCVMEAPPMSEKPVEDNRVLVFPIDNKTLASPELEFIFKNANETMTNEFAMDHTLIKKDGSANGYTTTLSNKKVYLTSDSKGQILINGVKILEVIKDSNGNPRIVNTDGMLFGWKGKIEKSREWKAAIKSEDLGHNGE